MRSDSPYRFNSLQDRYTATYRYLLPVLFLPLAVMAADTTKDENELHEVVVTAARERTALKRETRAVAVVEREQLMQRQPNNVAQALQTIPNVDVNGGPRSNAQSPTIRGLEGNRILQVIDGVRQNTQSGHRGHYLLDPELLATVEVIKGPGGGMWGSGALGGVVAQRTLSAADLLTDNTFGAYIKQGYASANNESKTSGSLYGLLGESVDFLFNGYYSDATNLRLGNGQNLMDSAYRNQGGMAKWGWQFDEAQRFELGLRQSETHQTAPSNPTENVSATVPLVRQQSDDRNATLTYYLNPADNAWLDAQFTTYINQTRFDEWRLDKSQQDKVDYRTLGVNISNHSQSDVASLTYGADFYQDRSTGERQGNNRPIPPDGRSNVAGTYLQSDIPLGESWNLLPGLRYDYYTAKNNAVADSSRTEQHFSPSIGLRWQTTKWLVLSSRYDEAFRAPSLEELYTRGTHFCMGPMGCNQFIANPDLKPETAKNISVSAQMRFQDLLGDDSLTLDATYFHNRVNNYIDMEVATWTTQYRNVTDARLRGTEIVARYRWKALDTGISYARTDGQDQQTHQPLQNIPAQKWVADIGYHFFEETLKSGITLRHYQAQRDLPQSVTTTYPGYTLLDLYTTWQPPALKQVSINMAIDNLTDRHYRPAFNQLYAEGRNMKINLKYQY